MPYGGFLGWRQRLVAVPIEVVAIAGRQLAALDMTRAEFDAAPAWSDPAEPDSSGERDHPHRPLQALTRPTTSDVPLTGRPQDDRMPMTR